MMNGMDDEELHQRERLPAEGLGMHVHVELVAGPERVRAEHLEVLAVDEMDEAVAAVEAAIRAMPWYQRLPIRAYLRLRGIRLT